MVMTLGGVRNKGFTIVELLIVIVVIAILAAVTLVAYNGISSRARNATVQSDAESFAKVIENDKTLVGTYPTSIATANGGKGLSSGSGNAIVYIASSPYSQFCLQVSGTTGQSYYVTQANLTPAAGICPIVDGAPMQVVINATCPVIRTRAVDARDNRTYWVQKLADGKCWMLTNLAYAGGGTNTYGDTDTLTNGTGGATTYTTPQYVIPTSGSNPTTEPTAPSTSTDGGATNPQYGYLYNWCGAMGGQATAACNNATTPAPDPSVTVCPAGWRLPVGNGGEFTALNNAINGGSTTTDAGYLSTWLEQRAGYWTGGVGFNNIGGIGFIWSSTQTAAIGVSGLRIQGGLADPVNGGNKSHGWAVRCIAI